MKKVFIIILIVVMIMSLSACSVSTKEEQNQEDLAIEIAKHDITTHYGFSEPFWLSYTELRENVYLFECIVYEKLEYMNTQAFRYEFLVQIKEREGGEIDVDTEMLYSHTYR